jgi:RNA polymerase sigma-70 factor (ECF subfamily)
MTLADLYDEFEGRLRRYAVSLVQDPDRADDLVQETFIRAMAHLLLLEQLNRHQRRAWLYRVLKNVFIDEQRARRREQDLVEQLSQEARLAIVSSPEMTSPELLRLVPERYREVLYQRYVLGMTSTEIGQELGVPAATVRSRLYLARKWLRAHQSEFL